MRPLRFGSSGAASCRRTKRPRTSLLAALAVVAISLTGCGSSGEEGLPVHVVNKSVWDAHVVGCPLCGDSSVLLAGDPERKPGETGGQYFGWFEKRPWPVTYRIVVRGTESVCPFIDPEPGKAEGAVGTREVIYVVDEEGKCVVGPGSMDDDF